MSVLCGKREVCVGPTVAIQQEGDVGVGGGGGGVGVSSLSSPPTPYVSTHSSCILDIKDTVLKSGDNHLGILTVEDEEEEEHDEVESEFKGALGTMGSLEESLPIKRGLSNFYSGKSKSFANLSEVTTVAELAKPENPYNKRRRSLMASKWYATGRTYYSSLDLPSIPAMNDHDQQAQRNNGEIYKKKKTETNVSKSSLPNHEHKIKHCLDSPSDDTQRG